MPLSRLDLSLEDHNEPSLYSGCEIESLAGKLTLTTPPREAIELMATNLRRMEFDREEVTLSGGMAIWAYLAVFHHLHGITRRIYYEDGRGQRILVAAHG